MTTTQQALDAAKKRPAHRTTAEQAMVDECSNQQGVRNADFEARRRQRIYGPA